MEIYLTKSSTLHRAMLLIDCNVGIQDSDRLLLEMLMTNRRLFSIILTKCDKVKPNHILKNSEKVIAEVQKQGLTTMLSPIVHLTSTYSGYGIHELMCGVCHTFSQDKLDLY